MKEVDKQVDQRDFQIKQEKTSIIDNNNNKSTLAPLGLLKLDFLLSKILSQNSCIRVVSKGRRRQSKKVRGGAGVERAKKHFITLSRRYKKTHILVTL